MTSEKIQHSFILLIITKIMELFSFFKAFNKRYLIKLNITSATKCCSLNSENYNSYTKKKKNQIFKRLTELMYSPKASID